MNKIRHYRSELMWNQIQHIVELLNSHDLFAWDCIAIGSDFDGVINPLNGFLTQETIPSLQEYVERHAYNYMQGRGKQVFQDMLARGVIVRAQDGYGLPEWIRISVGTPAENARCIEVLKEVL